MSNNENINKVDPNWANFDEMKNYAKVSAGNSVQLELSQDEIFNEYFSTFIPSQLINDCINLTNAYINYSKDKNLLEETKKFTEELRLKCESYFNINEDTSLNDEKTNIENIKEPVKKNETPITDDSDSQLTLLPNEIDEEEQKKIVDLKKKMKPLKIEYDINLSLAENQNLYDTAKKSKDEEKKLNKRIEELKGKMDELYLEYDENISYEKNKAIYDKAFDKSNNPSYKYPFKIYFKGCDVRQPDHIFDVDHQYTIKEICELMFKHGFKEYAGNVKLVYDKGENMFVPDFTSQRHG